MMFSQRQGCQSRLAETLQALWAVAVVAAHRFLVLALTAAMAARLLLMRQITVLAAVALVRLTLLRLAAMAAMVLWRFITNG